VHCATHFPITGNSNYL